MSIILGHEADGLVPLSEVSYLDHDVYSDVFGNEASERAQDFAWVLEHYDKSRQSPGLQRQRSLSDYMMHLLSLPTTDMLKYVPPIVEETVCSSKPSIGPTRVLYDAKGVTRTFVVNGVEALRTIPPFYYVNEQNGGTQVEVTVEALQTIDEEPEVTEQLDFETSWSEDEEPQYIGPVIVADLSDALSDTSSSSTYSPSSRSSSLYLSDVEMSDSSDADEAGSATSSRVASPSPGELLAANARPRAQTEKIPSTRHSTPVSAHLPVYQPPNQDSPSNALQGALVARSPPSTPLRPKTKSPSPLPSLTPSPPPLLRHATPRKRASPSSSRLKSPSKRARLSPSSDDEYLAGPSGSSSCSDDEYRPPTTPRGFRSSPMIASSSSSPAGGLKQYRCIVKDCHSDPFSAPKDRNRHMDTHFDPRFRCPGCSRLFPRDDALRRHCRKTSSPCYGRVKKGQSYEIHPPYWRSCSLNMLIRPQENDPLISLFNGQSS